MAKKQGYGSKAAKVRELLGKNPKYADAYVAAKVGCHLSYVSTLRKKMAQAEEPKPGEYIVVEGAKSPQEIDAILDARGSRYGSFLDHALITQELKRTAYGFAKDRGKLFADDQAEALDLIFTKIGRILNGDPNHVDSWIDIAGYAKLVADRLEGKVR